MREKNTVGTRAFIIPKIVLHQESAISGFLVSITILIPNLCLDNSDSDSKTQRCEKFDSDTYSETQECEKFDSDSNTDTKTWQMLYNKTSIK